MKKRFEQWMREIEDKKTTTAGSYASSINKISKHYSENTGKNIDVYEVTDLGLLKRIENDYSIGGKFSELGHYGKGTVRNAIATYVRFIEYNKIGQELDDLNKINEKSIVEDKKNEDAEMLPNYNFTYERDLKNSLILQAKDLFPGYKIYGSSREGIEYNIKGKRIDLLLENMEHNSLLAIELKAGIADYHVFGQISMYIGMLKKKFPDKEVKGLIISGEIDDSLKDAILTNDRIGIKTYKMELMLEDVN